MPTFVPSAPTTDPPEGIPIAPAPWTLSTQLYLFAYPFFPAKTPAASTNATDANPNNDPAILQGLPAGSYHPHEHVHPAALEEIGGKEQWKRGPAKVVLVRYSASPVGPYDELAYSAGDFRTPAPSTVAGRVAVMYVSTAASAYNGRRNWNIPKHLARFEFKPLSARRTLVKVYHLPGIAAPLSPTTPFFTAVVTDSRIPGVPIPNFIVGNVSRLVQPPLLPSDSTVIGTADTTPWLEVLPAYTGRWRLAYIDAAPEEEAGLEEFGDGVGFPKCKPWWIGMKFQGAFQFAIPTAVGPVPQENK